MIPFLKSTLNNDVSNTAYFEYDFDFETGELTGKKVTGNDAIKVWIYKALKTKRYLHEIYSWDFGQELEDLIGSAYDKGYINSEVIRIVTETLLINNKIKRCYDFEIEFSNDVLIITFNVETIYGTERVDFIV